MECAICNGRVEKKKGDVEFDSRVIGEISVPNLEYSECQECGDKLFTLEMSDKAVHCIAKKEQQEIDILPVKEFISVKDAAKILGITKQAFSKHPKVKRGLILSTTIDNRRYYLRKSVDLFKEKGNGKFLISHRRIKPETSVRKTSGPNGFADRKNRCLVHTP